MKNLMKLFVITFLLAGCSDQTTKGQQVKGKQELEIDSITSSIKPTIHTNVNRKYDEDGNLIEFDSIYTSYYTNAKIDSMLLDSLMQSFMPYFNQQFPGLLVKPFDGVFFQDSLLAQDFFYDDFFKKRFELNQRYINQMFEQMDSVKNLYFREFNESNKSNGINLKN